MDARLASTTLAVAFVLAGCGMTAPTDLPPSTIGSPAPAEASAPVVDTVQSPASSGNPVPSGSTGPRPTPEPDPDAGRKAAAAQYLAAGVAMVKASTALRSPVNAKQTVRYEREAAEIWGQWLAAVEQIRAPADTSVDLQRLIRVVTRRQALQREGADALAIRSMDDWYRVRRRLRDLEGKLLDAADRVRSDLGLPPLPTAGPDGIPHYDSFP